MRQLKITQSVTNRDTKAFEKYLTDIARLDLITQEREIELAKLIREGDEKALEELVHANLRFVVSVAKQYQNRGVTLLDLINEGNVGLIKAAKKFDETRGFKFISFAVWWIRQSILEAIANTGRLIRVPLNKIGLQKKFLTSFSKLEQHLGRIPTDEEIMVDMGVSEKEIREISFVLNKIQSYDAPISDDDASGSLLDILESSEGDNNSPDEPLVVVESMKTDINRTLNTLKQSERTIIEKFFGVNGHKPMSMTEIALEMDCTAERVRQIKEKALRRLRIHSRSGLLQKYLG